MRREPARFSLVAFSLLIDERIVYCEATRRAIRQRDRHSDRVSLHGRKIHIDCVDSHEIGATRAWQSCQSVQDRIRSGLLDRETLENRQSRTKRFEKRNRHVRDVCRTPAQTLLNSDLHPVKDE